MKFSRSLSIALIVFGLLITVVSTVTEFVITDRYSTVIKVFQENIKSKVKEGNTLTKREKKLIILPAEIGLAMVKIEACAFIAALAGMMLICFGQFLYLKNRPADAVHSLRAKETCSKP